MFFDDHLWNSLPDNTKVDGCFQKMGYIKEYRDDIIKWLDYDDKITDYSSDNICVIQFRGGDYLTGASWVPPEYYQNAAKHMLQKNPDMKFVCVTDDPEHARKFIPFAEVVGSAVMDEKDPYQGSIGWYKYPGVPLESTILSLIQQRMRSFLPQHLHFDPVWTNKECDVIAPKYWFDWKNSNGW